MKFQSRVITVLLSLAITLSFVPSLAFAESANAEEVFYASGQASAGKTEDSKDLNGADITLEKASYVFTSKAIEPSPVVKIMEGGTWKTLINGTDYLLSYSNNINAGKATVSVQGSGMYYGTVNKTFTITKRSLSKAKVTGIKNRSYTGRARTLSPVVKVQIGNDYVTLKKGRDYSVKYKNNRKISTGKTRAVITITGKGNYKGKLSRKFKIVKRSPGLYFKKKTVTRAASLGSFTLKPKKKVKGKITYTYSSSKPSVASVNKKTGKVTPKRIGTTVITIKSKATKTCRAEKTSYKLTVRALKKDELRFKFPNYVTNKIPLSTFRLFYNPTQAKAHYRKQWDIGNTGVCFGMSNGSSMLRTAGSGLTPAKFKSGAKNPSQLSKGNRFKSKGVTLKALIEAMHLSQTAPQCQKVLNKNTNNVKGMVSSVKSGYPVTICMKSYWGSGGHAVVGYKFKKVSKTEEIIYVYDSSNFSPDGCIYLFKNNKGKYTDWYYSYYEGFFSPASITYIPAKTYRSIWKNRKASKKLGQMYVSSNNFKILGPDGKVAAEMKDGKFSSNSEDIFLAQTFDFENDSNLVILPADKYTVQDTSGSSDKLTVTSIDENQSIEVTTDASAVVVETVDDSSVNKATMRVAEGESYEVSVLDGTGGGEPDEIVFTGEGTGKAITLGTDDGDCIVRNAGDLQLEINGVEKDFTVSGGVADIK